MASYSYVCIVIHYVNYKFAYGTLNANIIVAVCNTTCIHTYIHVNTLYHRYSPKFSKHLNFVESFKNFCAYIYFHEITARY